VYRACGVPHLRCEPIQRAQAPLMRAARPSPPLLPFLPAPPSVSAIYQRFTSPEEGLVQNIITAGDGLLVSRDAGITFVVNAAFVAEGPQTIGLRFQEARVLGLRPTDGLTAALAPALLRRGWIQHRALLALEEVRAVARQACGLPHAWSASGTWAG
jgi:hypothetical protein